MNSTTRMEAVSALCGHLMPELAAAEDFRKFESAVASEGKSLLAAMMSACLERFDASLRESMPRGWSAHCRAGRKMLALVGPVEFSRTVFVDELGRRRAVLDELLSIPPRSRLSPGSFLWLVRRAAEESYRKTAAAFLAETGCRVSHVCVMSCVRGIAKGFGPHGRHDQGRVFPAKLNSHIRLKRIVLNGRNAYNGSMRNQSDIVCLHAVVTAGRWL